MEEEEEEEDEEVLVETTSRDNKKVDQADQTQFGIYYHDEYDYLQHLKAVGEDPSAVILNAQKKEEKESGIQFLDQSDAVALDSYTKAKSSVALPSDVFASNEEMDVGLMNQEATLGGVLFLIYCDSISSCSTLYYETLRPSLGSGTRGSRSFYCS